MWGPHNTTHGKSKLHVLADPAEGEGEEELPPLGSVAASRGARLLSRPALPLRTHHQGLNPSLVLSVRAQDPDGAVRARHQLRPRRLLPLRRQSVADGGREGSQRVLARQGTRPPGEAQAFCLSRLQAERKRGCT